MKSVIATAGQENYSVLAVYYGIDTLTRVCKTGTLEQKSTLAKDILEHDLLPIIYNVRQVTCFMWSPNQKLVP